LGKRKKERVKRNTKRKRKDREVERRWNIKQREKLERRRREGEIFDYWVKSKN
jgi:hypothetical protein